MSNTEELSERLDELVEKAESFETVEKPLPYLGWFWRSIGGIYTRISWYDGQHWINEPGKWGYPSVTVRDEVKESLLEDLVERMEKIVEQGGVLEEDEVAFQQILYDHAGAIHREKREHEKTGEVFARYDQILEHDDEVYEDTPREERPNGRFNRIDGKQLNKDPSEDSRWGGD